MLHSISTLSQILLPFLELIFLHQIRALYIAIFSSQEIVKHQLWIIKKFKHILSMWSHIWILSSDIIILAQVIIDNIPMYQFHLYQMPQISIKKISAIISNFLWSREKGYVKFHRVKLEDIYHPKELGRWRLKVMDIFGWSLLTKSFWCTLFGSRI